MKANKPTKEQIKAAADRAQARSDGATDDDAAAGPSGDNKTASQRQAERRGFVWPEENKKGEPYKGSMVNVLKCIEVLKIRTCFDEFLGKYTIEGRGLDKFVGELDDKIVRKFRQVCFEELEYEPGKDSAQEGLLRASEEHRFNPIVNYLNSLSHDGVKRIDTWLTTYLRAEDTPLHRAWGRLVLIAACRRVFEPGCKWDHVLVLEGLEGIGKSTSLKVLASGVAASDRPKYFSDSTILDKDERAQMELTKGVWFYELGELSAANKADHKMLKAFVVRQEERARGAYQRFSENQPRIPIFVGTINPDQNTGAVPEYLNPGDLRRWWPLPVGVVTNEGELVSMKEGVQLDIAGLIRDRDQLFAEAMAAATEDEIGMRIWPTLALDESLWAEAKVEQSERTITDTLADRVAGLYTALTKSPASKAGIRHFNHEQLTKGIDYDFTASEVWITSKWLVEALPPTLTTDGRRLPLAMGVHGWTKVRDTRSGAKATCYVHQYVETESEV